MRVLNQHKTHQFVYLIIGETETEQSVVVQEIVQDRFLRQTENVPEGPQVAVEKRKNDGHREEMYRGRVNLVAAEMYHENEPNDEKEAEVVIETSSKFDNFNVHQYSNSLRTISSGTSSKTTRGRERSRSRDRIVRRDRSKERPKEVVKEKPKDEVVNEVETFDLTTRVDKEEEQRRLELEMTKRRERIERWRAERKRKELENKKAGEKVLITSAAKKWSLENESDDEEDVQREKEKEADRIRAEEEPEEEIDPLDAFMQEVNKEVRKVNKIANPLVGSAGGVMVVSGVAKKTVDSKKGEMMEQNQDGLEYSSEEEMEDIKDTAANLANKHKKELAKIDHSGVEYMPFRKDFYVEVPELTKMTQEEVDAYKKELEDIQVKGKGCPKPIKTWAHCGVSKKEMDVLKKLGFEKPTPIQCQAIPAIMSGRDLIGIAKTGSGKTLAFILPMFR